MATERLVRAACSDLLRASRDAGDEISLLLWIFIAEKLDGKSVESRPTSQYMSVKKIEETAYSLGPFLSMIGENGVASSLGVSRGKFGDGVGLDVTNNDGSRSERGKKKVERTRGLTSWIGGSSGRRGRS